MEDNKQVITLHVKCYVSKQESHTKYLRMWLHQRISKSSSKRLKTQGMPREPFYMYRQRRDVKSAVG